MTRELARVASSDDLDWLVRIEDAGINATAPREGSTNCGKNAKKNSAVFGFSRLTTKPSR